jgi:hypothetical protein
MMPLFQDSSPYTHTHTYIHFTGERHPPTRRAKNNHTHTEEKEEEATNNHHTTPPNPNPSSYT